MKSDADKIGKAIEDICPSDYLSTLDRTRPYNGQPWTDGGERGMTEVKGLTMRDLRDCFIRGCFSASGLEPSKYPKSVYELDFNQMDIIAVSQNMLCWVEKYMGIYPNVPKITDIWEHTPIVEINFNEEAQQ